MDRLPAKISPVPILEAIFELRYVPSVPTENLADLIFAALRRFYPTLTTLPLAQIPEAIRNQDPNLAFQATHQLQHEHHLLKIGPRAMAFCSLKQYDGWTAWSAFINLVLESLDVTGIIRQIDRIGLRYVNLFPYSILDKLQCDFAIHGTDVRALCSQYRVEIPDSGIMKVLQLSNNVQVQVDQATIPGSIIDIDCLQTVNLSGPPYCGTLTTYTDHLHQKAKELFFSLLTPEFLESLQPEYE